MGANIGTTITSWILSLTGIQSDNFIIQMFKPTSFSPVLAIIGVIFILFINDSKKKDIGTIFIGFAILMYGMDMMSSAVKPLEEVPEFTNLLLKFSNPLLGVIAGALLTAVIQSSSASVGILQALCLTGAVPFSAAIPIIMGQNIGTCITAILSAIGAKKNAKRAAAVHLYFNLIGTVIFMTVFYLINAVVGFSFFHQAATPAGIAVIHSVFNVTATIILLPFAKGLEKLACLTIRDKKEDVVVSAEDREFMILEPRFLEKPAFAVEQSRNAARKMAEESHNALFTALSLVDKYSEEGVERVENMESKVDRYEDELGTYLVKLSHKDISEADSHSLSIMLHCIGDFERISDHAVNIMESAQELYEKGLKFSENAKKDLEVLGQAVEDIVNTAYEVFDKQDMKLAEKIEPLEEVIDELSKEVKCFVRMALDDIQMTVSIIQIFIHLRHTDSNIGTMVCHTFQTGCNVRKDKSHLYCTFTVSQSLYMTKHFIMNWKTHESNISFHNNKQVDDKIPLPQAIWNEFWQRY